MRRWACVVGVMTLFVVACGGGENQPGDTDATEREPYVELTVLRPPRDIKGDEVLVRGTVTPANAIVAVRGEPAAVKDGEYQVRLKMRVGINRFTVVARHPDHQTNRRSLRVDREPPAAAPVPAPDEGSSSGCPPGQVPSMQMGVQYCRAPGPTVCPPGQSLRRSAGDREVCAPMPESDALEPCNIGGDPGDLCTPEENQAATDEEGYCGPGSGRFDDEGNPIPLPGC